MTQQLELPFTHRYTPAEAQFIMDGVDRHCDELDRLWKEERLLREAEFIVRIMRKPRPKRRG